jgi:hypothetical protein
MILLLLYTDIHTSIYIWRSESDGGGGGVSVVEGGAHAVGSSLGGGSSMKGLYRREVYEYGNKCYAMREQGHAETSHGR